MLRGLGRWNKSGFTKPFETDKTLNHEQLREPSSRNLSLSIDAKHTLLRGLDQTFLQLVMLETD